ncbi:MAG: hypothetical protein Q9200_001334 [Gallowayella weberi]
MQRAAASGASSPPSPSSPNQRPIDGPPSKRRKTSTTTPQFPTPAPTPSADVTLAFQAATNAEDAKRVAAIERIAAKVGETKWELSTADQVPAKGTEDGRLRFLTAGFSDIDQDGFGAGKRNEVGRRKFGRWMGKEEQRHNNGDGTANSDSRSSSTDEAEQDDNDSGNKSDANATNGSDTDPRRASKNQDQAPVTQRGNYNRKTDVRYADVTKTNEVQLKRLTSISGGGGGGSGGLAGMECHFCGEKGHKKADCPKKAKLKRRREDR